MQEPEVAAGGGQTRVVDVHYRRLDRENGVFPDELTFAEALRRSLRRQIDGVAFQAEVMHRVQDDVRARPGDIRCWNNILVRDGAVWGTLCLYRPSELQAVIQARGIRHAAAYPLDQVDAAGGRDFLRAIAYWMAIEDHFYLVQSASIQTGTAESYFEWLLRRARILTGEKTVRFTVALDRDAVGGDLQDLTSVNVGGSVEPPAAVRVDEAGAAPFRAGPLEIRPAEDQIERRRIAERPFVPNAWDLLNQVVHDERSLEQIQESYRALREVDPHATLDVDLEFYVRLRRRRNEQGAEARQRALRALSAGLRDMPDGTVTARGRDGTITGNEIRLKAPRRVGLAPLPPGAPEGARSALLDLDHVFQEMRVVHERFLADGKLG
jgi:hypothetical protein